MNERIIKSALIRGAAAFIGQTFIAPQLNRFTQDPKIQGAILAVVGIWAEGQKEPMLQDAAVGLQVVGVQRLLQAFMPQTTTISGVGDYEQEPLSGYDDEIGAYEELDGYDDEIGAADRNLFDDISGLGNLPQYLLNENTEMGNIDTDSLLERLNGLEEVLDGLEDELNGLGDVDGVDDETFGSMDDVREFISKARENIENGNMSGLGEIEEVLSAVETELYGAFDDINGVDGVDDELGYFED